MSLNVGDRVETPDGAGTITYVDRRVAWLFGKAVPQTWFIVAVDGNESGRYYAQAVVTPSN